MPDDEIINKSNVVGEIDRHDVWKFESSDQELYFFVDANKISAFVLLLGSNIRGIKNISGKGGQVTALISFVVHKLNRPLKIASTEDLTPAGLDWVVSLIQANGRGFKLSDQSGNYPDAVKVKDEWYSLDVTDKHGPIEILIEGKTSLDKIDRNVGMLMPITLWLGDTTIL